MKVSTCMRTHVVIAGMNCEFSCLLKKISAPAPRTAYIVDDSCKLLGIVSARDLLKEVMPSYMDSSLARSIGDGQEILLRHLEQAKKKCAGEMMVTELVVIHPDHPILEADSIFAAKGFNTLPVVDSDGKLLGEVSRFDMLQRLLGGPFDHTEGDVVDLSKC